MTYRTIANFTGLINYKIIWDITQSTAWKDDLQMAIDNQACHGFVFALGQQNWTPNDVKKQVLALKPFNLPWAVYYAFGPYGAPAPQVDKLMTSFDALVASLGGEKPSALFTDFELHRDDWTQQHLSDQYEKCAVLTKARTPIPVVFDNYSGTYFFKQYMPMAYSWAKIDPYWNASWLPLVPSSWIQFHEQISKYPTPVDPNIETVMWQLAAAVWPMMPHPMDYSRIDRVDWYNYLFLHGPKPISIPPPPPPPTGQVYEVTCENLTVRSLPYSQPYPGAPIMSYLHAPDRRTILEWANGTWGRFATARWANFGPAYAKKVG